jgi:acyl-CoA thioesterase
VSTSFELDTAVAALRPGTYRGIVSRRWWVERGPNGGYVAAMILRAMTDVVGDAARAPRSLTVHFTAAPEEGPVGIDVGLERAGRALSTLSARMTQGGRLVAVALAAFSRARPSLEYADGRPPEVAPPDVLEPVASDLIAAPAFLSQIEERWAFGPQPLSGTADGAHLGGWMRPREPQAVDAALLVALCDMWAPAVFAKTTGLVGAPTVDLTVHLRATLPLERPAPGDFLLGSFRTTTASEGFWEEDGELWSREGRLLAQSRQLALAIEPRRSP